MKLGMRGIIRLTMALAAGAKLDSYEVLGLLGAGGMGEVYRARDSALKREVAIKVLPSFVSQDPDRLHRFEQEARAAAALNHPNILAVYQFGVFDGAPYLVSELLEGGTLRQILQRGPLPVRKAIDYAVQVAHGAVRAQEDPCEVRGADREAQGCLESDGRRPHQKAEITDAADRGHARALAQSGNTPACREHQRDDGGESRARRCYTNHGNQEGLRA